MEMNSRMKELLDKNGIEIPGSLQPLHHALQTILDSGVVEFRACFFLKALLGRDFDIDRALEESIDKTELEASVNTIFIQAIIYEKPYKIKIDEKLLLEQGLSYGYRLKEKLREYGFFNVILSLSSADEGIVDCNVRFFLFRERAEWIKDNLEDYLEEAIILF